MSVSLLRHVFSQPLLHRSLALAAAARFNSSSSKPTSSRSEWGDIIDTAAPADPFRTKGSLENLWKSRSENFMASLYIHPRNAYTGRSIEVVDGGVAESAKFLDKIVSQNSISREWATNRRHKQKGEERRRLRSMRWRRRFRHEVGEKVQLVKEIRLRGA